MKTFYENKNNKYKEVDTNGNTIYLLTTWEDGSPNAWEDANKLAKAATAEAWRSGLFKFMARKPATAADFFDELPYTSTSDFAAVWNCSCNVVRASDSALHLEGVSLAFVNDYTEPRAVFVWCEYNATGDEVRYVYEVAATDYTAALYGDIDEIKNARAEVGAAITETQKALDSDHTGAQWEKLVARLDLLKRRAAFLKNNERQAVARLGAVALADVLTRYAGKRCGAATSQKIRDEFKKATGARLVCSWETMFASCHVQLVRVQKISPEGYTTANGEAVDLVQKAPKGLLDFVTSDNVIIAPLGDIVPAYLVPPTAWTADEAEALQELQKKVEQAIQDARALVREYNDRAPDGIDKLRATL